MDQESPADVDLSTRRDASFCYEEAFSRNLGWVTDWEQQALRGKRCAIAGMGGVGGFHLLTLARFGVGAFSIVDPDKFELVNFNRQVGATLATIGRSKAEVMAEMGRQINPELQLTCISERLTEANLDAFLAGADVCIDGLDFFVLDIRRKLNARCRELGIPVINAAPLGMGTAFLIFTPSGMSFEDWFQLDGLSEEQQYVSYLVGMAPSGLHRGYLADLSRVDLRGHRGPSTVAGCELCAAVASVEAVKLLLRRGPVRAAPYYHHFDAYQGRWMVRKLRGGNRHPLQRVKIALTRRFVSKASQLAAAPQPEERPQGDIEKILDLARWAPSGENIQPWRFQVTDEDQVVVHVDCPDNLYEYSDGEPTLLSAGFLLETMRIAASRYARDASWSYLGATGRTHTISVQFPLRPDVVLDPLLPYITLRSVDRGTYRPIALTSDQKAELAAALGPALSIEWHETLRQRWRLACVGAMATAIRLMIPEAFSVHQRIIDWDRQYSSDRVPAAASGMSRVSLPLMRWAMRSWWRMRLLNAIGGTRAAQIQMDILPGLRSSAFFSVMGPSSADWGADSQRVALLRAGIVIQRFWLVATRMGLVMQPTFAPLCFAWYANAGQSFTRSSKALQLAQKLASKLRNITDAESSRIIFRGRIGSPQHHTLRCRSVRRQLGELLSRHGLG